MNAELVKYIEDNIFPLYTRNDWSHQIWHIEEVIQRSLELAKDLDVDMDMVYTIAAFHDLGCYFGRENHEKTSAMLMEQDAFLQNYFGQEEIKIISEAIVDHRGSLEYEPRSIYGRIISTADRFVTIEGILRSTHGYTLEFLRELSWEQQVETSYKYIQKKYGENGYAKIWLPYKKYDDFLKDVEFYLQHKDLFEEKLRETDLLLRKIYKID